MVDKFSLSQGRLAFSIRDQVAGSKAYLYQRGQLYYWLDGIYVKVEDQQIENEVEALSKEMLGDDKVSVNYKRELIEHIKAASFMRAADVDARSPLNHLAFKNGWIDIDELKAGSLTVHPYSVVTDMEQRDNIFFQKVPHNINTELLTRINPTFPEEILKTLSPKTYSCFASTVGERRVTVQLVKIGYCFYRANPHKLAFMELGEKDTGKTTFLNYLAYVLGVENISTISLQNLSNYPFADIGLRNKLANIYDELTTEMIRSTSMLKMLTGESRLPGNRKFKEPDPFYNFAKPIFSANKLPDVRQVDDDAFFSRWLITPYENKFERTDSFFRELTADEQEIEGTIIASLYALKEFLPAGRAFINDPGTDYAQLWKRNINSVYNFIETMLNESRLKLEADAVIAKDRLYGLYTGWCNGEEIDAVKKTSFTQELERMYRISAGARIGKQREHGYTGIKEMTDGELPSSQKQISGNDHADASL